MTAKTPVTEFNKYLWSVIKNNDVFSPLNKYKGLTPIVPTQQQPEFENNVSDSPYLVYTWRRRYDDDQFWINYTEVVYIIYDESDSTLNEIEFDFTEALKNVDDSAGKVNAYLKTLSSSPPYYFLRVKLDASNSSDPVGEEGGRNGRIINILLESVDMDS